MTAGTFMIPVAQQSEDPTSTMGLGTVPNPSTIEPARRRRSTPDPLATPNHTRPEL